MNPLTVERDITFKTGLFGKKCVAQKSDTETPKSSPGKLPRITKLMALAIRFEELLRTNVVSDYVDLARLGHVTRARITQIMNLRLLAPDIQEEILFLPRVLQGTKQVTLKQLQPIAVQSDWKRQRRLWKSLSKSFCSLNSI
jgi:hypothetical protein